MADPIAIVTGGRRGIGRAIAEELARGGFHIAIVDLARGDGAEAVEAAVEAAGRSCLFIAADVSDIASHGSIIAQAQTLPGKLCTLVNNAGVSSVVRGDMLELSPESFDRAINVNLRASFFLSQSFAKRLLAEPQDAGAFRSIINITSINAEILGLNRADYCISKAGMSMMTKLFAARLAEAGILVYEIRPGVIRTEMTVPSTARYDEILASGGVPIARWGLPADVGSAVAFLARGSLPFTTGSAIEVDGGLHMHRF